MPEKFAEMFESSWQPALAIVVVILVSLILFRTSRRALDIMLEKGKLAAPLVTTMRVLLRWTFSIITLLLVLQQVGVLENVWAALLGVLAAVAIGFVAGWSILSNVFSTLLILIYRPFLIGDSIEVPVDSVKGEVVDINFMYTTLKGEEGVVLQVPNNTFFLKPIQRIPGKLDVTLYEQLSSERPYDA